MPLLRVIVNAIISTCKWMNSAELSLSLCFLGKRWTGKGATRRVSQLSSWPHRALSNAMVGAVNQWIHTWLNTWVNIWTDTEVINCLIQTKNGKLLSFLFIQGILAIVWTSLNTLQQNSLLDGRRVLKCSSFPTFRSDVWTRGAEASNFSNFPKLTTGWSDHILSGQMCKGEKVDGAKIPELSQSKRKHSCYLFCSHA